MASFDLKAIISAKDEASKIIKKFGDNAVDESKKFTTAFLKIGIAVGTVASGVGYFAIKAASDLEETASKFDVVYSGIKDQSNKTFALLRKDYDLSTLSAKKFLSGTGDLLTGLGFTQEEALELSDSVVRLGIDLTSFQNYAGGTKGAIEALTKGLLGEREMLKGLGIVISEDALKRRAQEEGIKLVNGQMSLQEKAMLTLAIATEQSKNAVGDYTRTKESFTNQVRKAKEMMTEFSTELGTILLPYATEAIKIFTNWISSMGGVEGIMNKLKKQIQDTSNWIRKHQLLIIMVAGAIAGPLVLAFGNWAVAAGIAAAETLIALAPIMLLGAAIAGVAYLIYKNWEDIKGSFNSGKNYIIEKFNNIRNDIRIIVDDIVRYFRDLPRRISKATGNIAGTVKNKFKGLGSGFSNLFRQSGGSVSSGQPYIVGEAGPEFFVPSSSGRIVPNNQISNSVAINFYGNINNTSNASLDAIGSRLARQLELARMGVV